MASDQLILLGIAALLLIGMGGIGLHYRGLTQDALDRRMGPGAGSGLYATDVRTHRTVGTLMIVMACVLSAGLVALALSGMVG